MKIFFTMDLDWCSDFVLEDTLNLFIKNNIKCTIFSTHSTQLLNGLNENQFEISIHPNFNNLLNHGTGESSKNCIEDLLNKFPNSLGVRSHSMTQSTPLLDQFYDLGLKYESNQFVPYNWNIKPYELWNNLYRIPYNWEDDIHFLYNKSFDYSIKFNKNNFYVLDFHPIHIFLNTLNNKHYLEAKKYYKDRKIKNFINSQKFGVRDFLLKTISEIFERGFETGLLKELI